MGLAPRCSVASNTRDIPALPVLYYELHVTIEYPELGMGVANIVSPAKDLGWHMGDLLLVKQEGERSRKDLFFTARAETAADAESMFYCIFSLLLGLGHKVIRYKLEDTVIDSRIADIYAALG